jgi:hypothetical protein
MDNRFPVYKYSRGGPEVKYEVGSTLGAVVAVHHRDRDVLDIRRDGVGEERYQHHRAQGGTDEGVGMPDLLVMTVCTRAKIPKILDVTSFPRVSFWLLVTLTTINDRKSLGSWWLEAERAL